MFSSKKALQESINFLNKNQNGVLAISGPTASGKTGLSIKLAQCLEKHFFPKKVEIISVDSRQIFRDMPISSALVSEKEMEGIIHHGLQEVSPETTFDVHKYKIYGLKKIREILSRKNIPMFVGGTMLWLDSILLNYEFSEKGKKSNKKGDQLFPYFLLGCYWDRENLYKRMNERVIEQFKNGLIDEAKSLKEKYDLSLSALTSFGYQEIHKYLDQKISYEEAIKKIQKRNRNYAKRQNTWWRGRSDMNWIQMNEDI